MSVKDFCDAQTKKKCDSFYKEAFLNSREYVKQLEKENQKYKEIICKAIKFINEENYKDDDICVINGIDILDILKEVECGTI